VSSRSGLVEILEIFVPTKSSKAKISSISTSPEREDTILVENPFEI
jgi:hypothetical protein